MFPNNRTFYKTFSFIKWVKTIYEYILYGNNHSIIKTLTYKMYYTVIKVEDESSKKPIVYFSCNLCKKKSKKEKTITSHIQVQHSELIRQIEEGEVKETELQKPIDYCYECIKPRDSKSPIKKVFHLADIHIRNYLRYEEYSIIFQQLYEYIQKEKDNNPNDNNIIVVCGDIFHTKQRLSPEAIYQGIDFFKKLSDIYPVFLILGNHDAVIHNKNKPDSLTPILTHSSFKINYLKYSGVYRYNNILFNVSSLLDDGLINKDIFNKICSEKTVDYNPECGDLKVGLYHGPIATCKNDTGFQMKGGFIIHDFSINDYTLLGDIHKFQYLDENKKIAYSSSLISQSFSETDDDHGVLVWDFKDGSSQYKRFYNDYAYKSFVVKDECYEDHKIPFSIDLMNSSPLPNSCFVPKFGRIRLVNECSRYSIFLDNLHKFEKKFPETDIQTVNNTLSYINDKKVESSVSIDKETFIIDYESIMNRYLEENFIGIDEETKQWVIDKMDFRNKKNVNNIQWKLLKLDFSNMLGYGKDNTLDFRKYQNRDVIGLFAENSCGKSSLLDIITFLLFSKINRNTTGNEIPKDIIHVNETKATGSIYFEVSGKIHRIEKLMEREQRGKIKINQYLHRLEPVKTGVPVENPIIIFDKTEYQIIDLTEEQRKKTDEIITSLIGDYNDFIFTAIFLQSGNKNFREMTQKDRKEFLYHILGLNFFKTSFDKENDEYKECKTENKRLMEELENLNTEIFEEQLSINNLEKDDLEESIAELKTSRDSLNQKMKTLYSKTPDLPHDIKKHDNPLEFCRDRLSIIIDELKKSRSKENDVNEKLDKLSNKEWKYIPNKETIEKKHKKWEKETKTKIADLNKKLESKQKDIKPLHSIKKDVSQNDIDTLNDKLTTLTQRIADLNKEISNFSEDDYNKAVEKYEIEIKEIEKKQGVLEARVEEKKGENAEIKKNMGVFTSDKLEKWKDEKDELIKEKERYEKDNEDRRAKIDKLESSMEGDGIEDKMDEYRQNKNKLERLEGERDFQRDIIKEYENHEYNPDCRICMKNVVVVKGEKAKKTVEELDDKIADLKKSMDDTLPQRYETYKSNKKELDKLLNNYRIIADKVEKRRGKITDLDEKLKLYEKYSENKTFIKKNEALLNEYSGKLDNLKTKWLENPLFIAHQQFSNNSSELKDNNNNLERYKLELEQAEFFYNQKLDNEEREKHNDKINASIKKIKNEINEMGEATDDDYDGLLMELELERDGDKKKVVLMEEMNVIKSEIQKMDVDKTTIEKHIELLDTSADVFKLIKETENEIADVENEIENTQTKMLKLEKQQTEIEVNMERFIKNKTKMDKNKMKIERLEILVKCMSRDGVILYILDTYLPKITELLNDVLHPFIDRELELCLSGDNLILNSYPHNQQSSKGVKENHVNIHGGMESFMIDLAFKIVLSRVACLPKSQMLFIDEGISAFDNKRISTIENLFDFLNIHFLQTIMISHIEGVKEKIHQRIEIEKQGKYSKII